MVARSFLLSEAQALDIMHTQVACITQHWESVCDDAKVSEVDKALLWGRQFLNPYAFEGMEERFADHAGRPDG